MAQVGGTADRTHARSARGDTSASTGTGQSSGPCRTRDCGGGTGIGENSVIRHLGRWAGSLAIDTGGLTDEQLKMWIRENSRPVAGRVETRVQSALQPSTPRVAELGKAPGGPVDE